LIGRTGGPGFESRRAREYNSFPIMNDDWAVSMKTEKERKGRGLRRQRVIRKKPSPLQVFLESLPLPLDRETDFLVERQI